MVSITANNSVPCNNALDELDRVGSGPLMSSLFSKYLNMAPRLVFASDTDLRER